MWKFIVGIVGKLKPRFLASVPILLFTAFILLNVFIWWSGPSLTVLDYQPLDTVVARILASSMFTLLMFTLWGLWQWRKLVTYQRQQKHDENLRKDPIKVFEEHQETELNQVIENLKKNLDKRNYLYELPWYLVLGLENAGKTSLINRSGQNFVFSSVMRATGKRSSNPYSFDWWIGDNAIVIDPDGELLTQGHYSETNEGEMERRLWLHFVDWLERTRSRRPLNGIVLALDISHLAVASVSERKAYASLLRARLRELIEVLSTRLPVYITLTKLDLIYGFEAFFKHCPKNQREEVLGFTFSLDSIANSDQWLEEFGQQYAQFTDRINDRMPSMVCDQMSSEDRHAIYSFSRQLSGMKSILIEFFKDALSSDQFSTAALVRGAYFTSVYQQGVPTNAFDDAASRRYGLSHAVNAAQNAKNSTVYFTQKLFSHMIYPEAGLASDNNRVMKQKRKLVGLSLFICGLASVMLISTWHKHYLSNIQHSDAVLTKVNHYKSQFEAAKESASQREMLESLNKIREATLEFGFFRGKSKYISDFGLYQGHTIGPKVEETYLNLLKFRFLPKLMADAIVGLERAQTEDEKLSVLRVFRMMIDNSGRHQDYVLDHFSKRWQREFTGQRGIQDDLLKHLDYALHHTDLAKDRQMGSKAADRVMKPYDSTIAKAQAELSTLPTDQRVYRNLKLQAQLVLGPSINLRSLIGPAFDTVFSERVLNNAGFQIPQLLTKQGFEDYFIRQSEEISELALIDSWVLGQAQNANFSEADKRELKAKIRQLYADDYINTWQSALNELDVKYFNDIHDAVAVLENITGNAEPFERFLQTVSENTQLLNAFNHTEESKKQLVKTPKYELASSIEVRFSELSSMVASSNGKPSYLDEVIATVEEVKTSLQEIKESPDSGMAALNATKNRVKLSDRDPIYTLKRVAAGLPSPLDAMFAKIADESWYVIKHAAIKHLEVRWHDDVYQTYQQKLAGRYPFNSASSKDVSLKDFEAFFAPNGKLNRFYVDHLKVFIDENININVNSESDSLVRADVLQQFEQAEKIRSAFFNRKGILDVNFSVEPLRLSSNKRRSVLNVDGQYLSYSHGPREGVELIWPNTLRDNAVSKVTLVPTKANISPRSIDIQGPWAFFRLLDKSDVVAASTTSVDYKFSVDEGEMIYRIHSESDANPFTERLFKSFKLSNTLY